MIPQDYIYELTQRSDVVDIVQSYVQLRRRGRTYTGLCPFHNEKTPSFVVYPETQSYYCFGCGAGGGVINFTMRYKNLEYVEAVKELAARCGMPAPNEDDTTGKQRTRILSVNKDTARFFFNCLNAPTGTQARAYWRGRGLSDATIKRFGLGYAPDSFHALLEHLRGLHYTEEEMLDAGVIKRSEKGSLYDVFRNRVMVPIFDLRGNVVAFGGRVMTDEKPKYINSPETLAYKKSRTVFALNIAKKSTGKKFILCEGYMDTISMHQAGFTTAIACCGTALTAEQVKLISDYTEEVVLCYDSDEAGQKATARAIELFSASPVKISVLKVPDAKDPDEFIKKFGADRFAMLVDGSANAIEFRLMQVKAKYDLATPDGRVSYIKEAIGVLAGRATPTERDVYAGRMAEETDVAKAAILNQLTTAVKARMRANAKKKERALLQQGVSARINIPYSQGGQKALGVVFAEQQLIMAILKNPDFLPTIAARIRPEQFISEDMRSVYVSLLQKGQDKQYMELSVLSAELPAETVALLSRMLAQNYDVGVSAADVEMYISRMQAAGQSSGSVADTSLDEFAAMIERKRQNRTDLEPEKQ